MRNKFKIEYMETVCKMSFTDRAVEILTGTDVYGNQRKLKGSRDHMFVLPGSALEIGDLALYKVTNYSTKKSCFMVALKKDVNTSRNSGCNPILWDCIIENADKFQGGRK